MNFIRPKLNERTGGHCAARRAGKRSKRPRLSTPDLPPNRLEPREATMSVTDTSKVQIALAAHADAIRAIGKRVIADVIEIGERLTEAKKLVGHGGWLPWLDREFGWTEDTALNFMRCHELAKSRNFRDLSLPVSALYLISKPSTPDSARDAVLDLAAKGERVTHAQAKDIVDSEKNRARPVILREMKLGEDVVAKIRGTSLDKARELDELIMLNRGAPQGKLTPVVAKLVADAAAGKNVSAVATTAQRGEVARLQARIEELTTARPEGPADRRART